MSRVYCQDCIKYCPATTSSMSFEHCIIMVDDYRSPNHEIREDPKALNVDGKCGHFELKIVASK